MGRDGGRQRPPERGAEPVRATAAREPRAGDREEPGGAVGREAGGTRARRPRAATGSAERRGLAAAAGQGRGDPSPARPGPVLPSAAPGLERRRAGGEVGCGGPGAPWDAAGRSRYLCSPPGPRSRCPHGPGAVSVALSEREATARGVAPRSGGWHGAASSRVGTPSLGILTPRG